jgi:signal transduction histidine kinase/CheY-like chemotaxis protein
MNLKNNKRIMPILAIALLAMISASVVIAFIVRQKQKNEISAALEILRDSRQPVIQVENTLEALFMAENEFKEYTLSYNKIHFENYKFQITRLMNHLDTLQAMIKPFRQEGQEGEAGRIIEERNKEAGSYIRLKRLTDSLMIISANIESVPFEKPEETFAIKNFTPSAGGIKIDTLDFQQTTGSKSKGLFGKIKTFLVGEEEQKTTNAKVVVKTGEPQPNPSEVQTEADTSFSLAKFAGEIINKSNTYYQMQMRKQLQRRNELRQSELKLVRLNSALMDEIRQILFSLKETASQSEGIYRSQSTSAIVRSTNIMHNSMLVAALAAFLLAIATAVMMRKNLKHQAEIMASKQKAIKEADEKRRFLAYMSHEFRTPLSSVIGFAEQLEQAGLSNEQMEYLSAIISSSEILLTTVNDILDLSKLEAGKMTFLNEPFRPDRTIRQVIRAFESTAKEKGLAIRYKPISGNVILTGDEVRLKQILNNLVSNAIKYTVKGYIEIHAELKEEKADRTWLDVKVSDSGIGIPAESFAGIFNEYTRVHTETSSRWVIGTGLGLPVTKRLIDNLGGKIEVNSKVGKGSVFAFKLPYLPAKEIAETTKAQKTFADLSESGLKLLVADDNFFNILLLKTIFKRSGLDVDVAENGSEALEKLKEGKYDLLLSDMYMPGMDGLELTRTLRQHHDKSLRKMPVIMITGNVSEEAKIMMNEAGVSNYLFKPFQQSELLSLIGKYVA